MVPSDGPGTRNQRPSFTGGAYTDDNRVRRACVVERKAIPRTGASGLECPGIEDRRGQRRDRPRRRDSRRLRQMMRISRKAESFTESVIRDMNRLAVAAGAVSLAQGFPDFPCPPELKVAAAEAVAADHNQYAITFGAKPLRDAIAAKTARFHPGWIVDAEAEITVVNGATEG